MFGLNFKKAIAKLNPVDDIHDWVEKRLAIFKLEMGIWTLEIIQNITNKGIDGVQADMKTQLDELEK